jgi:hypothetical protein
MCNELFPRSQQIPDYCYLAENIFLATTKRSISRGRNPLLHLLKNGRAGEALERLKEYEGKKYKDGVVNPHTYIANNRNKVNYPAYKSQSLYIGSGPVKSGNKVVVQRRCRQHSYRSKRE